MVDQPTCGQGLAENSVLPARLGDLIAAMAQVLEVHTDALDLADPNSQRERDVYLRLVATQGEVADRLRAVADDMTAQRHLPMGKHKPEAMASPKAVDAFAGFVGAEAAVLAALEGRVKHDRELLDTMRGAHA